MEVNKTYRIVGSFLTFLVAFLAVSNYSSYTNASEELEIVLPQIQLAIQEQSASFGGSTDLKSSLAEIQAQFEENLTVANFRMHSLYKIVGSIVALVGIVLLRRMRGLGLHLFIGGIVLCVGSGLFLYGLNFVGALYTLMYIIFGVAVSAYYWSKRCYFIS